MLRVKASNSGTILLLTIFLIIGLKAETSPVSIFSSVDTSIATIGDRVHLNVIMNRPEGVHFEVPVIDKELGDWEVLDQQLSEPKKIKDIFRQQWTLELTVFDTGKVVVPPLEIRAVSDADSTQSLTFLTDEYIVDVISVLPPGTMEPKDIKPPFAIRKVVPWSYIIFGTLIIAIVCGWWYYYRRWKRRQPPVALEEHYLEAPHVTAFRKLEELKAKQFKTETEIREYYFQISEIIREYLERRYFIKALEMTTREIMDTFRGINIEANIQTKFKTLFEGLDLVKFAKLIPENSEMITYWDLAYNTIDITKREPFLNRRSS